MPKFTSLISPLLIASSLFLPTASICAESLPDGLSQQINTLIEKQMPRADVGVAIMNADDGKLLYEHDGYQAFSPASNVKLYTAAAALYTLGPSYRYHTRLMINKSEVKDHTAFGNVYIVFSGDPTFTMKDLQNFIREIKQHNINEIRGNIILDNTRFSAPDYAPGSSYEDHVWYFTAPINAIMINQNAMYFQLRPSKTLGDTAKVVTTPIGRAYASLLPSTVKTVTFADSMNRCSLVVHVSHENTYSFSGCWPINQHPKGMKLALRNPALFAERIIRASLKDNGIRLKGQITTGKAPKSLSIISEKQSDKLKTLLITMMKESNNIYAESLTKTLGAEIFNQGTFLLGADQIKDVLYRKAGISFQNATLVDGAGASRYDLLSPITTARLLYVMYHSDYKDDYIQSLPDAGIDGTLHRRMTTFDMKNSVAAKTGSMRGVSTLSGYIKTLNGKTLTFSIMVNHITSGLNEARQFQDQLLQLLRRY